MNYIKKIKKWPQTNTDRHRPKKHGSFLLSVFSL
jgi:hypothetical protein